LASGACEMWIRPLQQGGARVSAGSRPESDFALKSNFSSHRWSTVVFLGQLKKSRTNTQLVKGLEHTSTPSIFLTIVYSRFSHAETDDAVVLFSDRGQVQASLFETPN
jgi:hypothetical protein